MLADKKILAVIPARGGSKGLPRKNILPLAGKPLLAWSIIEGKKSRYIDKLIVSSEDEEILQVAREWGADVPFIRPAELSGDEIRGVEPLLHAVQMLPDFDYVVYLQPTSPLRTAGDIDGCVELAVLNAAALAVSVTQTEKSAYWACTINDTGCMNFLFDEDATRLRRQELPTTYVVNGAVYVADCNWFLKFKKLMDSKTLCYEMPRERSVDIDTRLDMVVCEALKNFETNLAANTTP